MEAWHPRPSVFIPLGISISRTAVGRASQNAGSLFIPFPAVVVVVRVVCGHVNGGRSKKVSPFHCPVCHFTVSMHVPDRLPHDRDASGSIQCCLLARLAGQLARLINDTGTCAKERETGKNRGGRKLELGC